MTIKYKETILIPLSIMKEEGKPPYITESELIAYRVKIAEAFAKKQVRIDFEVGLDAKKKFINDYSFYITETLLNQETTFALKEDTNIDDILNLLYNSIPLNIINVLTNEEAINAIYKERERINTLKLKYKNGK